METLSLGGQTVSRIGLGTWAFGASEWANVDRADSIACLRAALDYGVNLIDTAPIYGSGRAELLTGEALAQHIAAGGSREDMYIATKFGLDREAAPIPAGSPAREPDRGSVVANAAPR